MATADFVGLGIGTAVLAAFVAGVWITYARAPSRLRRDIALGFTALAPAITVTHATWIGFVPPVTVIAVAGSLAVLHPVFMLDAVAWVARVPRVLHRVVTATAAAVVIVSVATRATFDVWPSPFVALPLFVGDSAGVVLVARAFANARGAARRRLGWIGSGLGGLAVASLALAGVQATPSVYWLALAYSSGGVGLACILFGFLPPRKFVQERADAIVGRFAGTALRDTGSTEAPVPLPTALCIGTLDALAGDGAAFIAPRREAPGRYRVLGSAGRLPPDVPDADTALLRIATSRDQATVRSRSLDDPEAGSALAVPVRLPGEGGNGLLVHYRSHIPLFPLDDIETLTRLTVVMALTADLDRHRRKERDLATRLAAANLQLARGNERMRAASQYTRGLIEAASDAILTVDRDGRITDANAATAELVGQDLPTVVGSRFVDLVQEKDGAQRALEGAFRHGRVRNVALTMRSSGLRPKAPEVLVNARAYRDGKDAVAGVLVMARDVTDLRRAERESAAQAEAARRAERLASLGVLVAGVAHEINNPLMYVGGNLELALMDLDEVGGDEDRLLEMRHNLEVALAGTQRIGTITRDLKAFSRKDTSGPRIVDLGAVVRETAELVSASAPPDVRLDVTVPPTSFLAAAAPTEAHQVVLNLVKNATEALPATGGNVVVELAMDDPDFVTLRIKDDGPGIPVADRDRLFTPFFTTKTDGTGLGLSIVHGIVTSLGGTIDLEEHDGPGAWFRLRLPVADPTGEPHRGSLPGAASAAERF